MSNILTKIIENKRAEVVSAKLACSSEMLHEVIEPSTRDFRAALANGRERKIPQIIAEIKRRSPSCNAIKTDLQIDKVVEIYNDNVAAISILTDFKFFGGTLEDLDAANEFTRIPLLRKDFIIDEYQLLEARQFGADAVLLIAAILDIEEIEKLLMEARKLGLDVLVEVHNETELEKVLQTSAEIIGINNRNLDTLVVDLNTTLNLSGKIPREKIIVAESGISTPEELIKLAGIVDAALIGTSILMAADIEKKLKEFTQE